jgi:hypothetical protein
VLNEELPKESDRLSPLRGVRCSLQGQ